MRGNFYREVPNGLPVLEGSVPVCLVEKITSSEAVKVKQSHLAVCLHQVTESNQHREHTAVVLHNSDLIP